MLHKLHSYFPKTLQKKDKMVGMIYIINYYSKLKNIVIYLLNRFELMDFYMNQNILNI